MKRLLATGIVGAACAGLLAISAEGASAQAVLSAEQPAVLAAPAGRLQIGRGKDYVPSTVDPQVLFDGLRDSMKKRREFGWQVVLQLLQPVKLTLLDGVTEVEVPLWQTWYEGLQRRSSDNPELERIFELYFKKLKPVLDADPNADVQPVIAATIAEFAVKDLSSSLTDGNLSSVLHQLADAAEAGPMLGRGTTLFSPSFVEHAMLEARGIDECDPGVATADRPPPSPDQFSHCIDEFPRSAVMVKTSWRPLGADMPDHDTSAAAMAEVIRGGTWPGPGHADKVPPLVSAGRSGIYTNVTTDDTEWGLTGIHFVTKDVREWVWVSLWWDPDASTDFGADQPAAIAQFNNGVWKNYKMCVASAFAEGDPKPWAEFEGPRLASLRDALKAVYDGIQDQIDNGAVALPQSARQLFRPPLQAPLHLQGALGPWPAPHNQPTSWCSNPNVEMHPGNARTSCIGCHQFAFTRNESRNTDADFRDALVGDLPQFARTRARRNFTAEFSWSFHFEYRPSIAAGKALAGFEWPAR